ncbi:MAG TPA: nitronate monooxygenase [Paraburkholderia sp.]|uniref:nitronate monooxygenase n=1 Tax=Paraburkholderia sp. TaxID=1926495 RepID=UPI002B49A4B4|nr:nitronate monooxygenase [Paraburkholderia sp.]HKR41487.1 nitronate monooxygenase [Paraburkholderia sp.]
MSIPLDPNTDAKHSMRIVHRPVCDLFDWPAVLATISGEARAELVSVVARAGGVGIRVMMREPVTLIHEEVSKVRASTSRTFGVPAVALFGGVAPWIVRRLREAGIRVARQVGSIMDVRVAEAAGAIPVIAQGREAGDHVGGDESLVRLLPDIVDCTRLAVLASGGINDGTEVANALSFGAQGIELWTALKPTHEMFTQAHHEPHIVVAGYGDTLLTDTFHIDWPTGALVRVLTDSVTHGERGDPFGAGNTIIGVEQGRPFPQLGIDFPLRSMTGHLEAMALYGGTSAARSGEINNAAFRVHRVLANADAAIIFGKGAANSRDRTGGTPRQTVILTSPTMAIGGDSSFGRLVDGIRQGDAHRFGVLTKSNQSLDASLTRSVSALPEKAMNYRRCFAAHVHSESRPGMGGAQVCHACTTTASGKIRAQCWRHTRKTSGVSRCSLQPRTGQRNPAPDRDHGCTGTASIVNHAKTHSNLADTCLSAHVHRVGTYMQVAQRRFT